MNPFLRRVGGHLGEQMYELEKDEVVIGRAGDCDIVLDPRGVSRRHAVIRREGPDCLLIDLASRNRTMLNEQQIEADRPYRLQTQDRINICDVEFVFYATAPPEESPEKVVPVTDDGDATIHAMEDASSAGLNVHAASVQDKFQAIIEITQNLCHDLDIDTVGPKIVETLFKLFEQCERCFLILVDPKSESGQTKLIRKAFKHRPPRSQRDQPPNLQTNYYADEAVFSISRSIVDHVLVNKKAVLSKNAANDPILKPSESIDQLRIRSVMCAPLLTPDGRALGILQLDTSERRQFDKPDLDLLTTVAGQAAIAIENTMLYQRELTTRILNRDLDLAQQVQRRFLPARPPEIAGFEFFAYYHPTYQVGGDYYDFFTLKDGRLGIALGDVAGKGIAAALMMAKYSGDSRLFSLTEPGPAAALAELNRKFCQDGHEDRFITTDLMVLDPERRILTLASAGHQPIMIRRADGQIEEIGDEIKGFPLGVMPETDYDQVDITLEAGDVVVVYSDGVTDARNTHEEIYDTKLNRRLLRRVADLKGRPRAVGQGILQDIREFSDGHDQADDITLVCFGPVAEPATG